ncbi:MAG: hypothetical protein LH624_16055 [Cryobacterium sp.]|nr:hypothetical protein [Cryobacterium sp.]
MAHEVHPRLLKESWAKHHGHEYRTSEFHAKMELFADRQDTSYGEAFRGCTLLADVAEVAPRTRFLILVRDPLEYVRSAHFMKVLNQGGSIWDTYRLMPAEDSPSRLLATRLASHWETVNSYLLDFAARTTSSALVGIHGDLDQNVEAWAAFAGVRISDRADLRSAFSAKPNRSITLEEPTGFDADSLRAQTSATWSRAIGMAGG